MTLLEISSKSIVEIEQMISAYPWCSYARRELLLKLSGKGKDYWKEASRKEFLYLYPDLRVLVESEEMSGKTEEKETRQIFELDYNMSDFTKPKPKKEKEVIVIGGDYFSKDDFKELKNEKEIPFMGLELPESSADTETVPAENADEFKDENFYTETLAKIYADQELYDRANEVYDKLILLYPEKSVYFATLKDELKKKL